MAVHHLPSLSDFVGRHQEIARLNDLWQTGFRGVVSIEAIGGSGKSALAQKLVEQATPQRGVVWSFYTQPDGDAFLRELHLHIRGKPLEATGLGRADLTLEALGQSGRTLLVLDGLERIQKVSGGLEEASIQFFLDFLARGRVDCLCLITTRFPLQLEEGATHFVRVPLPGLETDASVELLRRRGVQGSEEELAAVNCKCGGHPLTVALAGGAIGVYLGGQAVRFAEVESLYVWHGMPAEEARLTRVLAFYREHLPRLAIELLARVCLFRTPVDADTLIRIFCGSRATTEELNEEAIHLYEADKPAALMDSAELPPMLDQLASLGLLERTSPYRSMLVPHGLDLFSPHPAIRDYFAAALAQPGEAHAIVADFLSTCHAAAWQQTPAPKDMGIVEEMIYHRLEAGSVSMACLEYAKTLGHNRAALDSGEFVRGERVARMLLSKLKGEGASQRSARLWNDLAVYLDYQGRLQEAAYAYIRALHGRLRAGNNESASRILQNLADNAVLRGRLPLAQKCARRAIILAAQTADSGEWSSSNCYDAYIEALRGKPGTWITTTQACMAGTPAYLACDILLRQGFYEKLSNWLTETIALSQTTPTFCPIRSCCRTLDPHWRCIMLLGSIAP